MVTADWWTQKVNLNEIEINIRRHSQRKISRHTNIMPESSTCATKQFLFSTIAIRRINIYIFFFLTKSFIKYSYKYLDSDIVSDKKFQRNFASYCVGHHFTINTGVS